MRIVFFLIPLLLSGCTSITTIKVTSTPSGATVTEAGKGDLGATPLQLVFSSDDCLDEDRCIASFYFRKQGYKDVRVERYVKGGEILIHGYLIERKTQLTIKGYPPFANIESYYQNEKGDWDKLMLSGKNADIPSLLDEKPWHNKEFCRIRLFFESPGFQPIEKELTIKKGEKKSIEFALNEYFIDGEFKSDPMGADVYEKTLGYLGRTPFSLKLPYDQLVRISPQRRVRLEEPIFLHLTFKKTGFEPLEVISSIGELHEMEDSLLFSIPANLIPITHKK